MQDNRLRDYLIKIDLLEQDSRFKVKDQTIGETNKIRITDDNISVI